MNSRACFLTMGLLATTASGWSCGVDRVTAGVGEARPMAESPTAQSRVEELRARFLLPGTSSRGDALVASERTITAMRPALGPSVATGFEQFDGSVRPLIPADAKHGAARTATVTLPVHAGDPVRLEDDTSHMAVSFALRDASDVTVTTGAGVAIYPGALGGADVLHRVHGEGTEDYVVFEQRPAREEIAYEVDVSQVAGLRLVSNTLEFLDAAGAPRLRVAPPYVVDANGARREGRLTLERCAFDASPKAPWGRGVTSPGAARCGVRVAWGAATYPAMVDPSWTATGSMVTARNGQTATLLASGKVLMAGGANGSGALSSAELYDPTAGTFASTGAMTTARQSFTATLLASGEVLMAAGSTSGATSLSSAELYDPTAGTFAATGSLATSRYVQTATLLASGKVLVAGGWNTASDTLASAELYDPTTATFGPTGSMTTARYVHCATLLSSGKVLVAGGYAVGSGNLASAELYDPTAGTFTATGSMTAVRNGPTATLLGSGHVLIAAGSDVSGALSSAELYDPTAGTFAATGSMTTARYGHAATKLASGQVLVAGGTNGTSTFSVAEIYDPSGATFASTASLLTARSGLTVTLLGSGQVLAAGGSGTSGTLSSAELFGCITTCPAGDNCGTIPDGCGGTVSCGSGCTLPQTCAGGGTPNVCGCTPTVTTCPAGDNCGTIPNGCGGTVSCGSGCTLPDTCAGAGMPNVCGCTPTVTMCPAGDDCGTVSSGCGGTVSCGTCGSTETCTANHCVGGDAGVDAGGGKDAAIDSSGGKDAAVDSGGGKDSGTDAGDSGSSSKDSSAEDSGKGEKDSGMGGKKDSGAVGKDSGSSGDASDGGVNLHLGGGPTAGCSCRTAQRRDAPSNGLAGLAWLGVAGLFVGRLRRSARPWPGCRVMPVAMKSSTAGGGPLRRSSARKDSPR